MSSWNFKRKFKIMPGVHLNLSKGGISTSIGIRGFSSTFGNNGIYLNAGIPGTGLYKRQKISTGEQSSKQEEPKTSNQSEISDNIFSLEPQEITSQDMQGVKVSILNAHKQRDEISIDIIKIKKECLFSRIKLFGSYILFFGFFIKKIPDRLKQNIKKQTEAIIELEKLRNESYVNLEVNFDETIKIKYEQLINSFKELVLVEKIWDITRGESNDRAVTRSAASRSIVRKETTFGFSDLDDIKFDRQALFFKNINGADLYFYPNFLVMKNKKDFAVIGFNELEFNHNSINFIEEGNIPSDTKIIDYTWLKVNKNGAPDKRFKDNRQIPIVEYGVITLKTTTGLNEEYQFSNLNACQTFGINFDEYRKQISVCP